MVAECYQELYRFCSAWHGDYRHVRTGVAQHSGFIDACIRLGVGKPEREKKSYPVGDCPRIAVERRGDGGYIILLPHCRHAVSVGGTSSDSGDCDGLRFCGLRI